MKSIDEKNINELQSEIERLRVLKIDGNSVEINIDFSRWIGNGSGLISIMNNSIRFYLDNDIVTYITDDKELLLTLTTYQLDLKIKELIDLKKQINTIFNSYY